MAVSRPCRGWRSRVEYVRSILVRAQKEITDDSQPWAVHVAYAMADLRNHAMYVAKCTYWCRFLGFTSLWFKALTVALDLEPCLGNSTCNEPADETQALLCDGLWALQHDFCMWCTARQKVIRLLSRSFVLLCCMLKFRMYACCCNTHAHMCTHTHASGSHVCMDRGPWYRWMELMVWFRHHSIYVHLCTVPEFQATEYYVQLWSYGVCL